MPDDSRIETLEIKIAHLESALQDLSDVLYRQQQQLDGAEQRWRQLAERLASPDSGAAAELKYEIPPHY